jgi:hypothetical protein
MNQLESYAVSLGLALSLAACSGSHGATPQSAVGRNFDELARSIAGCATAIHACDEEDGGANDSHSCRTEFLECRSSAGKTAEERLIDAIADCREANEACREDASADAGDECAQTLRGCIGEARVDSGGTSNDAGTPNPHAPTYQCFGQLRECVADAASAAQCAADARGCVIAAVGEPKRERPGAPQPSDAGVRDAGTGGAGKSGAGNGGAGGAGANGGRAGKGGGGSGGGDAGSAANAGVGGGDSGAPNDAECAAEQDDCLANGEKAMKCEREYRKCLKDEQ